MLNLKMDKTVEQRSDCAFSPLAASHFFVNYLREFGVKSSLKLESDKFVYS